jgi:ParB-like chromosome segregation protein Spo0J
MEAELKALVNAINASDDPMQALHDARKFLHDSSPTKAQPVDMIHWVPIERVSPNDYNPNSVANKEMQLLYTSIKNDGYTQPVVTIYDDELDKYVIIDGFHRYFTCKNNKDISDRNYGRLPIVVLNKSINDRMASTVRHNRARGKHSVTGMSSMVFKMLDNGWEDSAICNELGMEPEELLRLKHITGFSKLFEDTEYKRSWVTKNQIKIARQYEDSVNGKATQGDQLG